MITIQSGKLTIPENERFVGFAGDNTSEEKQFVIENHVVPNSVYTLYLRFDDGEVSGIVLPSHQENNSTVLTWSIRGEHLKSPGIVTAQLKMTDGSGNSTHTTRDYFLVGYSADSDDGSEDDDDSELLRLEERIEQIANMMPFVSVTGAYITVDDGDVRIARYSEVYSKSDIDGMIGNIESLLAAV